MTPTEPKGTPILPHIAPAVVVFGSKKESQLNNFCPLSSIEPTIFMLNNLINVQNHR